MAVDFIPGKCGTSEVNSDAIPDWGWRIIFGENVTPLAEGGPGSGPQGGKGKNNPALRLTHGMDPNDVVKIHGQYGQKFETLLKHAGKEIVRLEKQTASPHIAAHPDAEPEHIKQAIEDRRVRIQSNFDAKWDRKSKESYFEAGKKKGLPPEYGAAADAISAEKIAKVLENEMLLQFDSGYNEAKKIVSHDFEVANPDALKAIRSYTVQLSTDISDAQQKSVQDVLEKAVEDGWDHTETQSAIELLFEDGVSVGDRSIDIADWADMVAQTELNRAYNLGTVASYEDGGVKQKTWVAADDARTCDFCHDADGETVGINEDFPSVDVPNPPAHPYCLCGLDIPESEY